MSELSKRSYVVLEFSSADSIRLKNLTRIEFNRSKIIEIAAVKIQKGKIADRFSRFIAIDGYDPNDIKLEDLDFNNKGVINLHLIGAKSLKEEIYPLNNFIEDSVLIMRGNYIEDEFKSLKDCARNCGIEINNTVVDILNLLTVYNMRENITGEEWEKLSPVKIAQYMNLDYDDWFGLFACHNVDFDPTCSAVVQCRNDSLTWALAIAQLYINLFEELYPPCAPNDDESMLESIDKTFSDLK